ncbi:hypothetical protein AK88_01150 [Plasmodium fragile]|uniref:Uncharacterized protein n=1 Tax=Plasmodium fragile TaxID=5857 RepID=A0A0D9QR59_PLAFR|nr:uncharacterized protein AK88_01150 [Plasmodium fragile]KJP89272.1 hypothetical protein AK88_01150 [Plasmodium fragile]
MGRNIQEFYNLRHRYLDKRKETNLNILKSTRNKITFNNDVEVTNTHFHLGENKDECNNNAPTSAHKVKAQRKTAGLRQDHECGEHSGRHKDRTKPKDEEKGSDKSGKMCKMVQIAKIHEGDKSRVNDTNHANKANKGPEGSINRKTGHKGKECHLRKSEECKDHYVSCEDQHTGECEIIRNTNETGTCSDVYVTNSNNSSAHHKNDKKLNSHWGFSSNEAHVHLVEHEKNNNLNINNVNNSEIKNVYDVLDKNVRFICSKINGNGTNTTDGNSTIIQSEYRRKNEQQNKTHATSNICYNSNNDEKLSHATIICDTVNANLNAKNDDHANDGNSYYGEKYDYEVKNMYEAGIQMNQGSNNNIYPFTDENDLPVMEDINSLIDHNVLNERIHTTEKINVHNIYKVSFPKEYPDNLVTREKYLHKSYHFPTFLNKQINELTDKYAHCAKIAHHGINETHDNPMDNKLQMYKAIYRHYSDRGQSNNSQNVKGITSYEDSGEQNSNQVSVNTCRKNLTHHIQNNFEDEHKSNIARTKCFSSNNSEQRGKSNGTNNSGSEHQSTNYRTPNGNNSRGAYSSRRNNGHNDNYYGHNCNRSNNAKNGSDDDDKNSSEDNKNGRDHDKNASDDDKNDSDDEKNESDDDKNERDHGHNEFDAKGRPHRDSFKFCHKAVNPDYGEQQIQQSKFYSKEAQHEELSNVYKKMQTKHMNSSGDLHKGLYMQQNKRNISPNNKYLEEDRYVRSDDITIPINHFLKRKETYNWNKEHYDIFHSLNDIISEVKKKSNFFINNYKNTDILIDNNNNALKSKINSTLFSHINKNGNYPKGIHPPIYADSNMRKTHNAEYVNNNLYKQKLGSSSALNIKHTSHLGARNSIAYHAEMDNSGYTYNGYRSNHIDHISGNSANCSEYDCDEQPFRNDRSPVICNKMSSLEMYNMGTQNRHVGNCTKKQTLQYDGNFKTARTDPFEYSSNFLHKNKLKQNSYCKRVMFKNVGHKVDRKFVQIKTEENISAHTDPLKEYDKMKDIYMQENPNGKNSLINKDMYINIKGTENSNSFPSAQHNKGTKPPFDSSLMNSYSYLQNELKDVDDIHTSISNGNKAHVQWSLRRNMPTTAVQNQEKDTPYSNTRSNAHQPMSHHHEVTKASRNNTEKEMKRKIVTKGYLHKNHNFLQYNQYAENNIILEDSRPDVTYEIKHANEAMGANRSSATNTTRNTNPFVTKCYNEQNDYEYIEDDNSMCCVNNDQPDHKIPYLIINPGHGTSDKMNYVNYPTARTLSGGDFLNTNNAHTFFHNGENNNPVCTVEYYDDVIGVIPGEVENTSANIAVHNYNPQSFKHSYTRGNKGSNFERVNCGGKKEHTSSAELPNNVKTGGSNYLTRSKSSHDTQHNYSDQSIDSIYDRGTSRLYEYDSEMNRKILKTQGGPKLTQKATKEKRKMRSLNNIDTNYSIESLKLGAGKTRKRGFKLMNKNISAISNGNGKRSQCTKVNSSNHDICNPNTDPFNCEKMQDDPVDMTNGEVHHRKISTDNINYEQSKINPYRQKVAEADCNGGNVASADTEGSILRSIDYYRNYDSVKCVKEDLLRNEKFPFIFYDSSIRNLVIYYKDGCSDEIKCKYFSAQRFGHATAKKIALNFLRSLGINPDHLENNNVFSYEKDSKSKLYNMETEKTVVNKEENSNINLMYDTKKRNVIVSWINKVKGYSFRKFSAQRFGFDVALGLSIDFYKNLGGEKEEDEIRNYINKVNSKFKSIRILANKKKKKRKTEKS